MNPEPNFKEVPPEGSNLVPSPNGTVMKGGGMQSPNYVRKIAGWRISAEGDAEFNDGVFRGNVNLGGTNITVDDVSEIQTAIDEVESEGGGTVFLQPGTYVLTADITVPAGVTLQGVSRDGVIIDCNTSYKVKIEGANVYSDGTVSINVGADEVVGSSTTFTSAMVGRYILLGGYWYEITAFTDTTHITIGDAFAGTDNLSGATYVLADIIFNASIKKISVTNATGSGVVVGYAMEPNIIDLYIYSCGTGLDLDYVVFPNIFVTSESNGVNLNMNYVFGFKVDFSAFNNSTTGAGVVMTNCSGATFFDSEVNDNTGDGLNLTSCENIAFVSGDVFRNGGQGIELVSGCNDLQFIAFTAHENTSDGYKLTATSDRSVISACSIHDNGGYGVNIAASTCDGNTIVAPAFEGNTSGEISDSGTNTVVIRQTDSSVYLTAVGAISAGQAVYVLPDNLSITATATAATRTSTELSLCSTTDQSWMVMGIRTAAGAPSAGTDTTLRILTTGTGLAILDSNAGVNGGLYRTLIGTSSSGTTVAIATTLVPVTGQTITVDATSEGVQAAGTTLTVGHTITGSATGLFVSILQDGGSGNIASVTYNGDAMTQVGSEVLISGTTYFYTYFRAACDAGSNDIVVTCTGSTRIELASASYKQVSGVAASGTGAGGVGRASAALAATSDTFIGFAPQAITAGSLGIITTTGTVTGLSGLSVGRPYYLSNTVGAIATSAGTVTRKVGISLSATRLSITNIW